MDYIDLLALVKQFGKLENIEVYGYISSRLPRPTNLFDSCKASTNSMFVKMDVLAVNLQAYSQHLKEHGITNKENNDIYLVNGSVALCVDSNNLFPDWYATRGTLRLASKTDSSYVAMFPFRKRGSAWFIDNNVLTTMDISDWDKKSRLYLSVHKSVENGFVTVPDDVARLQRFNAKQLKGVVTTNQTQNSQRPSLQDNLKNSLNNIDPVEVITSRNKFNIVNRDTILDLPDEYKKLEDILIKANASTQELVNSLTSEYSFDASSMVYTDFMIKAVRTHLRSKPTTSASTGRMLLKKYLSKFGNIADREYLGSTTSKYLIDDFDEIANFMLDTTRRVSVDGDAWKLCVQAFGDKEKFFAGMLAVILGVDFDKIIDFYNLCELHDISFVNVITSNPYLLLILSSDFTFNEVDYIAYCLGKKDDREIEDYKLACILYNYFNNSDTGSTVYRYSNILSSKIGTTLTKARYNNCRSNGTYLSETVRSNIRFFINNSIPDNAYRYPDRGWVQDGYNFVLPLSKKELEIGMNVGQTCGILTKFNVNGEDWITSSRLLRKELTILNKIYQLSKEKKGYDHKVIDDYIDSYERMVGFKLEKAQRDAVHLVDCYVAIVTGPAGSGKTTVSDCMVYVLSKLDNSDIEYAAPTGKAAKRLQEVVKKPVQTFNSKFKIFGNSGTSLLVSDEFNSANEGVTYFFDEVAMTSLDLMYSVCKNLSSCSLYLLGDICQLPPIGKGLPFKNFLRFLPCVKLTVTKRSAENSGITYNSNIINEHSDSNNWLPLKNADDFKLVPCDDEAIRRATVLLCKYYLRKITGQELLELVRLTGFKESELIKIENLTPDDIQVVSPIGKPTYSWGTYQLNLELQKIFNETKGYDKSFRFQPSENYEGTKFTIGDRVIHTDSNMYSMQWYNSYKDGVFQKRYGFGITNGDVGKIVAFYPSVSCEFENEVDDMPEDFEYPQNLRDDETFINSNSWFIVVEYYDFMSDSNYYILYRALESPYGKSDDCRAFFGEDLKRLALFYAGTTHKMQGSQAKLIIGLLGRVNFKGFLTRNMLYTEVTRASDGVYLIGSVSNDRNSQLSISRGYVADDGVDTVQELIFS